jgi:heat shock protein HslJ
MKVLTWMVLFAAASLVACATSPKEIPVIVTSENVAKLQGRQWELKSMTLDGRDIVMDIEANLTLAFGPNGKVTGYAAVNRFNGTYSFSPDGNLSWPGPGFVTTRKAGPPELMEKERAYLRALPQTDRAILRNHMLLLKNDGESTILTFLEAGSS